MLTPSSWRVGGSERHEDKLVPPIEEEVSLGYHQPGEHFLALLRLVAAAMLTAVSPRTCWFLVFFRLFQRGANQLRSRVSIDDLVSEALKPLLALLDSSAWASQEVDGEGGKFALVDFAAEVASILLLSSADCGRDTNNKPRPIRLKLVRDATGIYKASFHCFAKVPVP